MAQERNTDFGIIYDLTDTTALDDATPTSTTNNTSIADIDLLYDGEPFNPYITLEHNQSILDGSRNEFPDTPTGIAFFSREMSNANGEFTNNPTISVGFDTPHSSYALTLYFTDDHPLQVQVTWKSGNDTLYTSVFNITSNVFVVNKDVELYDTLIFEFIKTLPYHYIKLYNIRYGVIMEWDEKTVKKASMVQELNPLGDKLSINTLTFEVVDTKDDTNFGNELGMHRYFQKNQPMYPYEWINDTKLQLGKFYLNKFSNSNNVGKLVGQSVIGLLDITDFNDGAVYDGVKAGVVLEQIFDVAGITTYSIDQETYDTLLYGTLKPQKCRNALKEILFACHSVVNSTTDDMIEITKQNPSILGWIERKIKFSTTVEKNEYVSGVEIKYTKITTDSTATPSELVKSTYPAGTYTVTFSSPSYNIQINTGTLDKVSTYYVVFTISEPAEVIITGMNYVSTTESIVVNVPFLAPGERVNIKKFTTTLCNLEQTTALAEVLLRYYQTNRLKIKIKYLSSDIIINSMRTVANSTKGYNNYIAHYTKRNYDLSGGFIENSELMGYFDPQDNLYYATDDALLGSELYMADDALV